jgi:hypothetical protein
MINTDGEERIRKEVVAAFFKGIPRELAWR